MGVGNSELLRRRGGGLELEFEFGVAGLRGGDGNRIAMGDFSRFLDSRNRPGLIFIESFRDSGGVGCCCAGGIFSDCTRGRTSRDFRPSMCFSVTTSLFPLAFLGLPVVLFRFSADETWRLPVVAPRLDAFATGFMITIAASTSKAALRASPPPLCRACCSDTGDAGLFDRFCDAGDASLLLCSNGGGADCLGSG